MLVAQLDDLTPRQVWELLKLRVDVFVVEQHCPYEEIDSIDLTATHILAYDGPLVGYARVYAEEGVWHLGRLCVGKQARGTGLAQEIMHRALQLCDGPVHLTAQTPLVSWYEAFGFEVSGEEFDWDGIPHTPMRKKFLR